MDICNRFISSINASGGYTTPPPLIVSFRGCAYTDVELIGSGLDLSGWFLDGRDRS